MLDINATVLNRLDAAVELEQLACGGFRVGKGTVG
jgi:hypothetical protein